MTEMALFSVINWPCFQLTKTPPHAWLTGFVTRMLRSHLPHVVGLLLSQPVHL